MKLGQKLRVFNHVLDIVCTPARELPSAAMLLLLCALVNLPFAIVEPVKRLRGLLPKRLLGSSYDHRLPFVTRTVEWWWGRWQLSMAEKIFRYVSIAVNRGE